MTDFEELFRKRLEGANEAFDRADKDLRKAVFDLSAGLEEVTDGQFSMKLDDRGENEDGRAYDLDLEQLDPEGDRQTLVGFFVSSLGYPISTGATSGNGGFNIKGQLKTSEELIAYLVKMIENPDSPLMRYLAYQLRSESGEEV